MHGVPGSPEQWFDIGRAGSALNRWAQDHGGLAPVVVAVDANGGEAWGDTLCVDSPHGRARTYLTADVPAAVKKLFDVDPDPRSWAIGGLSRGGTCALQTALAAPDVYRTFLDMSGELHPLSGDRRETVGKYFGGDERAYEAEDPAARLEREAKEPTGAWRGVGGGCSSPASTTSRPSRTSRSCTAARRPRASARSTWSCPAATRGRCGGPASRGPWTGSAAGWGWRRGSEKGRGTRRGAGSRAGV